MYTAVAMTEHTKTMMFRAMAAMVAVEADSMVVSANSAQAKVTAPLSAMASVVAAPASVIAAPALASAPTATALVHTVASDKVTMFQEESLMMADAATSVVLAVLLSAEASEDTVLMDVDMTPSMTTVKLVASTPTVSSLLSNAMSVILKTLVVQEVSQAFTVTKLISLRDQDLADLRAVEAFTTVSVDSVMSVPTRTSVVSMVSAISNPSVVLTTEVVTVPVTVSANRELFLALEVTTFSIEEATKSDLVSPIADQTDAFKASV